MPTLNYRNVVKITDHAIKKAMAWGAENRKDAAKKIMTIARTGELIQTPNGRAIRSGKHIIGIAPRTCDGVTVTTYYPLRRRWARKEDYQQPYLVTPYDKFRHRRRRKIDEKHRD